MKKSALTTLILFLTACATTPRDKEVTLELGGKPGTTTHTRYFAKSHVKTYSDRQKTRDKEEAVDFVVRTRLESNDPKSKTIKFTATTVKKDGTVALHDFAFPELRETIDFTTRSTGEVLKAGAHPSSSIFFVPSLPFPKDKVAVGDTWEMEHVWYSAKDMIPLKLQMIGILKNLVSCEGGKTCADIELSGGVNLVQPPNAQGAYFRSRLWGRILFSLERGDVLWSHTRSKEDMRVSGEAISIHSCIKSHVVDYGNLGKADECEAKEEPVNQVPSL